MTSLLETTIDRSSSRSTLTVGQGGGPSNGEDGGGPVTRCDHTVRLAFSYEGNWSDKDVSRTLERPAAVEARAGMRKALRC